jgi:hypothetical protein
LHPRANVFHVGVFCAGGCEAVHPVSLIVSGAMVSDWTHLTPEHSLPEGIESFVSHAPSQPMVGSNAVCVVEPVFSAHVAAFAAIVKGSVHVPLGALHVHVPQSVGASRLA